MPTLSQRTRQGWGNREQKSRFLGRSQWQKCGVLQLRSGWQKFEL